MKLFAKLLNSLYFTHGHLDKMALLQRFFAETPDPERGYALAVMANTIHFPTFKRSLIKAIMQDKIDPVLLGLSYDYVGDLSETIALLWPEMLASAPLPLLSEIIHTFNQLKPGEMETYLNHLLNRSDTIERWALLKLGTGSLRIGISARFLKNTLAKYGNVTVEEVEKVWHGIKPPYIALFDWLEKRSSSPLIEEPIFFHPVMLSHPLDEKELPQMDLAQFAFERKYDGIRVQVTATEHGKALFTRTGENISAAFPDVLSAIHGEVVLDGELVIKTREGVGSFNDLQQRLNRKVVSQKMLAVAPAGIILYDILKWGDQDFRALPFHQRRRQLEQWIKAFPANNVLLSDLIKADNISPCELKQKILAENHPAVEGLMLKHKDSPYIAGRPKGYWFKWKREPLLIDAVLMYAQRGHGKRSSYYSDYTFGLWKEQQLLPIGKAYFGFTDAELKQLDQWIRNHTIQRFGPVREVAKQLVFEVAFDAVNFSLRHKSGVALRFPRIHRIRWDKPADEADALSSLIKLIL